MKNILVKYWPNIACIIFASFIAWPTFMPGYFSHHDDLQVMRIFEMKKCILDLQMPCRWVPDMGYGNGYPLFNYYAVFPYYIGAFAGFVLSFLTSAKLLFAIPIFLGAMSMYFLAEELFGVYPAILASVLYTYAPYKALDLYVRGDVAESFAMAIIPLCFYFVLKLIKLGKVKYLIGLALSLAIFLTSHNIMTVLFGPILLLITLYWLLTEGNRYLKHVIAGFLIGIGLSAFFVFPAYLEKNLVQIDNLIRLDLNFRAHFVTLDQLFFSRFWGYGASVPGPADTISFQIGWPHWWLAGLAILFFLINIILKKQKNFLPLILFAIFIFSIFMSHAQSAFIWEKIDILKFTQFPWRFLAVSIFSASLLGGFLVQIFKQAYTRYIVIVLVALTILLNWNYFRPKEFYPEMTDNQKLFGKLWIEQQKAAILDYLPKTALEPREVAPTAPMIVKGDAKITNFENRSNRWEVEGTVSKQAVVEVPVFDFPSWQVFVNGGKVTHSNKNYLGRISFTLSPGNYSIIGRFEDTLIRSISNIITVVSILVVVFISFNGKIRKADS